MLHVQAHGVHLTELLEQDGNLGVVLRGLGVLVAETLQLVLDVLFAFDRLGDVLELHCNTPFMGGVDSRARRTKS